MGFPFKIFKALLPAAFLISGAGICYGDSAHGILVSRSAPLSDSELDNLRGGFITPQGLAIEIGYEQLANINGELRPVLTISPDDISKLSNSGAADIASLFSLDGKSSGQLGVQTVSLDTIKSYVTLIQNSANNKMLGTINLFNISIKNLSYTANLVSGRSLQYALTQALR